MGRVRRRGRLRHPARGVGGAERSVVVNPPPPGWVPITGVATCRETIRDYSAAVRPDRRYYRDSPPAAPGSRRVPIPRPAIVASALAAHWAPPLPAPAPIRPAPARVTRK